MKLKKLLKKIKNFFKTEYNLGRAARLRELPQLSDEARNRKCEFKIDKDGMISVEEFKKGLKNE